MFGRKKKSATSNSASAPKEFIDISTNAADTSASSVHQGIMTRLTGVENLTKAVLIVALISLVGVIVGLYAIISDNMHFDDQMYQEQSGSFQQQLNQIKSEVNSQPHTKPHKS